MLPQIVVNNETDRITSTTTVLVRVLDQRLEHNGVFLTLDQE